jgi:hypothetical protein
MQIPHAFMVRGLRRNLTDTHHFVSGNTNRIFKPLDIPELKQCQVQTHMAGIEGKVITQLVKKAGEMLDVIHGLGNFFN